MKKLLCILVTVAMLLSFSACKSESNINTSPSSELLICDFYSTLWCGNYDEYCQSIQEISFPKSFVKYDALNMFGTFKSFTVLSRTLDENQLEYLYSIVDKCGFEYTIYVRHGDAKSKSSNNSLLFADFKSNMSALTTEESGTYLRNGVNYTYIKGKLLSITWVLDDIEFTLCGNMMLSDYPKDANNSVVDKLLSTSDMDFTSALSILGYSPQTEEQLLE